MSNAPRWSADQFEILPKFTQAGLHVFSVLRLLRCSPQYFVYVHEVENAAHFGELHMLLTDLIEAVIRKASLHGGKQHVLRAKDVLYRFQRYVDRHIVNEADDLFRRGEIADRNQRRPLASDVTQARMESYLVERKGQTSRKTGKPVSVATLNCEIRYLNLFGAALEKLTAQELGVREKWPVPHVRRLREPKRMAITMKMEDIEATMKSTRFAKRPELPTITPGEWWINLFIVNYVTGIRCRGLLNVPRPSEEDLNNFVLRLPAELSKNGVEREFPLNEPAVQAIRRMPAKPGETLFVWPYDITWFYQVLHRFQSDAGIPRHLHGLPHKLRKTMCTNLLKSSTDLVVVQRMMQHSTPNLTANNYCGVTTDEERTAILKMPMPQMKSQSQVQPTPITHGNGAPGRPM